MTSFFALRRGPYVFLLGAAAVLPAACSSAPSSGGAAASDAGMPGRAGPDAGGPSVSYAMQSTVAAGSEAFSCQYVSAPTDGGFFIVGASHTYTPGSHHMILYRTDLTAIPAGQTAPQDCYEGASGSVMSHVRGIIYAAQTPSGQIEYPAGVGLPFAAGEVFLMQTHYLNPSASSLDVHAEVTLWLSDGAGITTHAGVLFFYDPFIDVPPASSARAQMRCPVPGDVTLMTAASHYHARGVGYEAYLDPPSGPAATTPFYTSQDWEHPSPLGAPTSIPAGSRIRFSCDYKNTDPSKEYFQGQSATNNEMCMFIGIYYPDMGDSANFCRVDPDMFGTGTATCSQSLSCLQTCQASGVKAPSVGTQSPEADVAPCYQKCFVDGCPTAGGKIMALQACTRTSCATECAGGMSGACQACAVQNCGNALAACSADSCN